MSEVLLIVGLFVLVAFASTCTVQISGVATGLSCVSYVDCNLTCCTRAYTGCSGDNNHDEICIAYPSPGTCGADPCCVWTPAPPAYCAPKVCSAVAEGSCSHCGCNPIGSCTKKTCAQVALIDNNPDVCSGCNICGGDWQINNNRGNTPWSITVTGALDPQAGGRVDISGGHTLAAGTWTPASGGTLGFSTGGFLSLG